MMDYCLKLALERREKPGDDLLSDVALTEIDGKKLPDMVVAFNSWTTNRSAFGMASLVTDRTLLASARVIAEQVKEYDGSIEAVIPRGARRRAGSSLVGIAVFRR